MTVRYPHALHSDPQQIAREELVPIMWGTGTGSQVMSRIAAPMVGRMISSTVLTLAVIPAIYALVKQWRLKRGLARRSTRRST